MAGKNKRANQKRRNRMPNANRSSAFMAGGVSMGGPKLLPFPPVKFATLRYADNYRITEAGGGAGGSYIWRASDAYHPDFTGTGHQPLYFDQLCTPSGPYVAFSVPKVKFTFRFVNMSTTEPVVLIVYPGITYTPLLTLSEAMERPFVWTHTLMPLNSGTSTVSKTFTLDNAAYMGQAKSVFYETVKGNYGSSPGGTFFMLQFFGENGAGDISVALTAELLVRFVGLAPTQSS